MNKLIKVGVFTLAAVSMMSCRGGRGGRGGSEVTKEAFQTAVNELTEHQYTRASIDVSMDLTYLDENGNTQSKHEEINEKYTYSNGAWTGDDSSTDVPPYFVSIRRQQVDDYINELFFGGNFPSSYNLSTSPMFYHL